MSNLNSFRTLRIDHVKMLADLANALAKARLFILPNVENEIVDGALLDNLPSGNLIRLQTPDLFVSSTLVRSLIARGAKQLPVPPKVADYIVKHDLYQDPE